MNRKSIDPWKKDYTFGDINLGEVIFGWSDDKEDEPNEQTKPTTAGEDTPSESAGLQRVTCMVYNKGDDGDIEKKDFDAKFDGCVASLDAICGKKGRQIKLPKGKTAVNVKAYQWQGEQGVMRLECAITVKKKEKTMEFIRLTLAPDLAMLDKGNANDKVGRRDLLSNVTKEEDGTVWIKGIPMVDQGMKGYCVPATVARVFAYYGMDKVDMHALAALCETDSEGGTSTLKMQDALTTIGRSFHLKIKKLPAPAGSQADALKEYNREAKRQGKAEVEMNNNGSWIKLVEPPLWAESRAKKASDVKKWMNPIRKSIDAGVPVLWSVFVSGFYNREGKEGGGAGGAHMRMIIGYNVKENTIIYSDSWGDWATKRVMAMPEAFSVTSATYVLNPS